MLFYWEMHQRFTVQWIYATYIIESYFNIIFAELIYCTLVIEAIFCTNGDILFHSSEALQTFTFYVKLDGDTALDFAIGLTFINTGITMSNSSNG